MSAEIILSPAAHLTPREAVHAGGKNTLIIGRVSSPWPRREARCKACLDAPLWFNSGLRLDLWD
jgi:hypothetical protein